jgi:putative DNA primase/helicase
MAVELRTGTVRPARQEDYCTKSTAVAPGGDCPRWREFLSKITGGDAELQLYLQRVAGYCLTGITGEHALFFCYGTGANGKGVFINTLAGIWGDYAVTAPMETFVVSHNDRHPTELAMLRGARLVVAQETEQGRGWDEAKIKALTGGDRIAARFMRQDFFEFVPQFKLLIAGNHKPGLRGVDEAIRRRLHLIPFRVTIPPEERDTHFADKLKPEWPGILQWALDGCLEWQRIGLAPPAAVRDATDAYLAAEDAVANWLLECCEKSSVAQTELRDLYASWSKWCERTGEHAGTQKSFSQALEDQGYQKRLVGHASRTGFAGIAIREEAAADPYWNR